MTLRDTLVQAGFVMIATGAALAAWALVAGKDGKGLQFRHRPARSARSAPRSKKKK